MNQCIYIRKHYNNNLTKRRMFPGEMNSNSREIHQHTMEAFRSINPSLAKKAGAMIKLDTNFRYSLSYSYLPNTFTVQLHILSLYYIAKIPRVLY